LAECHWPIPRRFGAARFSAKLLARHMIAIAGVRWPVYRKFLSFALCFLLLGLQQELLQHPLTHLPDLKARHHPSLKSPAVEIACVECSLLAGAAHAAAGSIPTTNCVVNATDCIAFAPAPRYIAAPAYYQSRAPPFAL
jgi:hypothetical protein